MQTSTIVIIITLDWIFVHIPAWCIVYCITSHHYIVVYRISSECTHNVLLPRTRVYNYTKQPVLDEVRREIVLVVGNKLYNSYLC